LSIVVDNRAMKRWSEATPHQLNEALSSHECEETPITRSPPIFFRAGRRTPSGAADSNGRLDSRSGTRYHLSTFRRTQPIIDCEEVIQIPNIASASKRLRQSEKRRKLNRGRKAAIKRTVKQIRRNIEAGNKEAAVTLLPQLAKETDKAAKRNAIHKNKAARIKSRWMKKVEAL
jgi:small subunit ribosomal protein S20